MCLCKVTNREYDVQIVDKFPFPFPFSSFSPVFPIKCNATQCDTHALNSVSVVDAQKTKTAGRERCASVRHCYDTLQLQLQLQCKSMCIRVSVGYEEMERQRIVTGFSLG